MSDSLNPTSVGNVTFEPGARTNWHLDPGGQILLITGGTGYYQEKGSAKRIIRKGESRPRRHGVFFQFMGEAAVGNVHVCMVYKPCVKSAALIFEK